MMGAKRLTARGGAAAATLIVVAICSAVAIGGGWGSDRQSGTARDVMAGNSSAANREVAPAVPLVPVVAGRLTGANSCAAASCHGGGRVSEDLSFAASQIWQRRDPHARAWQVLTQPLALEMMRRLATPGAEPLAATEDARCLNCHATTEQPYELLPDTGVRVTEAVHHRDGVSCESCHGAASGWLAEHTTVQWRTSSAERKAELGFIDTTADLVGRAQICADCHVGGAGKDVNHDLIAAGHPRMDFDFRVFHANEPKHWTAGGIGNRNRPVNVELRAAYEGEAWLAGQLASGRAAAKLLEDRAGPGRPWPELAEYSCFSCHHDLRADSWYRLSRGSAGRLQWGTWTFGGVPAAIGGGGAELSELRQLMQRPFPDRELVQGAAKKLGSVFSAAEQSFPPVLDGVGLNRLAVELIDQSAMAVAEQARSGGAAGVLPAAATWDEAAQLYLGLHALSSARRKSGASVSVEEDVLLEGLREGLLFEENVDSPGRLGSADRVREWSMKVAKMRELLQGRAGSASR